MTARSKPWIDVPGESDFPLENLPYGVFETPRGNRVGVAIGTKILDLYAAAEAGLLDDAIDREVAQAHSINLLLACGRDAWIALRTRLTSLLSAQADFGNVDRDRLLIEQDRVRMALPFACGDYVDFYSSLEHATNLGKLMRPGGEPLLPNWRWLPIGYNGRSSTLVIDGTPIVRPSGQRKAADAAAPQFGPSRMLDFELEMGFVSGTVNRRGEAMPIARARDHIFGLVIVNDWSARDIQAWEYQPLGPFLGKSFATSISPWVVTLDALEPHRVAGPAQDPQPLPYLQCAQPWNYDIELRVELEETPIVRGNFRHMYWNMAQQLAHLTSNGTLVRAGDLCASGTISGPDRTGSGSLIELTLRGAEPLRLMDGQMRAFLEDGDTVTMRAAAQREGEARIGFGSVAGTILGTGDRT